MLVEVIRWLGEHFEIYIFIYGNLSVIIELEVLIFFEIHSYYL